jgi:hypothetical protein
MRSLSTAPTPAAWLADREEEGGVRWATLAGPEGNEFDVVTVRS